MEKLLNWIFANKSWIFSGIGVFLISLVIAVLSKRKRQSKTESIVTLGDYSPGKVEGDYEVNINEPNSKKQPQ